MTQQNSQILVRNNGEWYPKENIHIHQNNKFTKIDKAQILINNEWQDLVSTKFEQTSNEIDENYLLEDTKYIIEDDVYTIEDESYIIENGTVKIQNRFPNNKWKAHTDKTVTIGGSYHGVPFKQEGLLLHLDPGNYFSYPESGNIWYDISGNDNHARGDPNDSGSGFDDDRFPEWQPENGGRFYFNGSKGLNIESEISNIGNGTVEFWFNNSVPDEDEYLFDGRNGNGSQWVMNDSANIDVHDQLLFNDPEAPENEYQSDSNVHNRWVHCVIAGNENSESKIFIDGKEITDGRVLSNNSVDFEIGENFRIGNRYTSSNRFEGYFGPIRIYDHELTEPEVQHHYWNQKSRFME